MAVYSTTTITSHRTVRMLSDPKNFAATYEPTTPPIASPIALRRL
jgi:hypothetical protein